MRGGRKQDIYEVRKDNWPEKGYCAEEEERGKEYSDSECVPEDDESLKAALQWHIERCPPYARTMG